MGQRRVDSYVKPVFILALLYAAYFLPGGWRRASARWSSPNATPLLYTDPGEHQAAARILAFAVACEGVTLTLQALKRRLLAAEQSAATAPPPPTRSPACITATRSHTALERAVARPAIRASAGAGDGGERFSLLLVEIEDLATVTDTFGPLAADRVIVDVSESVRGVLRPSDVVARTRPASWPSSRPEPVSRGRCAWRRRSARRRATSRRAPTPAGRADRVLGAVPGREPRSRRAVRRR